jgi:putative transposase
MCWLTTVSRAGFYRSLREQHGAEEEVEVRAAIQEIAVENRYRYGYRRIAAELRRRGMSVNHKRVCRLMRKDNLLAIGRRRFVFTTNSRHDLEVYLNLAKRMEVTAANQLWVADLTYIRLKQDFVYLAVVMDRWSRRVVGWSLDRTLAARLVVTALERAIASRQPGPGLVHHSDRGIQYACHEYVSLLKRHDITPSMSRPANPWDNAACESLMKTLKAEEIDCRKYRDLQDLTAHVEEFIDGYYNQRRLHSALGYMPPAEFEQRSASCGPDALSHAPKMSFFRNGRSISPMSQPGRRGEAQGASPPSSCR